MSGILLKEVKEYLRILHDVDDDYLISLIEMSKDFIYEQTGVKYNCCDKVYKQCILLMVAHFYDNKMAISEKNLTVVPYSMDCLIKHINIRGEIEHE